MSTTWVDEVPPIGGPLDPQSTYVERLRPLVSNPGRWAIIKSGTPSNMAQTARALRLRQYHVPPGRWEFKVRSFRRGVHVGSSTTANLYARFLDNDGHKGPGVGIGYISKGAAYNESGHRVCPDCGTRLERPYVENTEGDRVHQGAWPAKCDDCWRKADTKWARKRAKKKAAK